MPVDSKRINGPENILWPEFFLKKPLSDNLIDKNELRLDGRKQLELRPSIIKVGMTSEATGSAYLECGKTKILCSVYGPRDILRRGENIDKGQLQCEFKYAPYSCKVRQPHVPSSDEKCISLSILQALESVVILEKFPKARLDIFIMVIDNDGSVIGNALTCAGAAICNAGIEMYGIVVGCSLRQYGRYTLLDPTFKEEELSDKAEVNHGRVTVGLMPLLNQVVMMVQDGEFEIPTLSNCIKELVSTCQKLTTLVQRSLYQSSQDGEENDDT